MTDLFLKIKLFYTKITAKKETYEKSGIRPVREWSRLLVISFVIFLFLAVYSFYLYMQIQNDAFFTTTETNVLNRKRINTDLINTTIQDINTRADETNTIINSKTVPPDPSQ